VEGHLAEQSLALHRRPAADLFFDLDVGPGGAVRRERVGVDEKVIGIGHRHRHRVEAGGQPEVFAHHGLAAKAHRRAPLVARAIGHLDRQHRAPLEVPAEDGRVDRGAEVVEVGNPDEAAPAFEEAGEQPARRERLGHVAVARGVRARGARFVAEEPALGGEAQRDRLQKGRDRASVEFGAERFADRPVGRLARHQPERRARAVAGSERPLGFEAQVEEGALAQRRHQRLDHAAHARRHAAGEHDERHLAPTERALASGDQGLVRGRTGVGQRLEIARPQRLDARQAVSFVAVAPHLGRPAQEALGIEARPREPGAQAVGQARELFAEGLYAHSAARGKASHGGGGVKAW
jgi:hypothetical protein